MAFNTNKARFFKTFIPWVCFLIVFYSYFMFSSRQSKTTQSISMTPDNMYPIDNTEEYGTGQLSNDNSQKLLLNQIQTSEQTHFFTSNWTKIRTPSDFVLINGTFTRPRTHKAYIPSIEYKTGLRHWTTEFKGQYDPELYTPPLDAEPKQRLPQALIIGIGRCGTHALVNFLNMSPYIAAAAEETHFFDRQEMLDQGLGWYRSQMPYSYSNQVTMEMTSQYFWSNTAPKEIRAMNQNMRLILIIKDPVSMVASRAARLDTNTPSVYLAEDNGKVKVDSHSRTVKWGIYVKYLKMWLSKFSLRQIHIIDTSDLKRAPMAELNKVETFLGVPHTIKERNFYFNTTIGNYCFQPFYPAPMTCLPSTFKEEKNFAHIHNYLKKIPGKDKKLLHNFYKKHNEELFSLLNRRFKWHH